MALAYTRARPSEIVFGDESNIVWVCYPKTVVGRRGAKRITVKVTGNEKTNSTGFFSAETQLTYPNSDDYYEVKTNHTRNRKTVLIFTASSIDDSRSNSVVNQLREVATNAASKLYSPLLAVSENGWMDTDLMLGWVKKLPQASNGWIIIDLFSAHRAEEVIDACAAKGYTIFFIPAGCTSKIQYHDVHFNAQFKRRLNEKWTNGNIERADFNPDRAYIHNTVSEIMKEMSSDHDNKKMENNIRSLFLDRVIARAKEISSNAELRERLEKEEKEANEKKAAEKKAKEAAAAIKEQKKADRKAGVKTPRAPRRPSAVVAQEKKEKEERRENEERQKKHRQEERDARLVGPSEAALSSSPSASRMSNVLRTRNVNKREK